jgi:hypothetical protein
LSWALQESAGKSLAFASGRGQAGLPGLPSAATLLRESFQTRAERSSRSAGSQYHGVDEVTSSSIFYLPATYTTLFLLAASLLLGLPG